MGVMISVVNGCNDKCCQCVYRCWLLQSAELTKLQQVAKSKERAQEAARKAEELNSSFSREAEKKLNNKLEVTEKNKNEQLKALRERLNAHVSSSSTSHLKPTSTSHGPTCTSHFYCHMM